MNRNIRILIKSCVWLLLGFVIMFIGITRSKAWTTMNVCSDSALSSCGKYRALDGNGTLSTKTIGTNYSGTIIGFDFFLSLNTQINKNYKIRINFYGDDLKSIVNASMVSVAYYDGSSWSDATLVGIQKQNPSGYSTWIDIYFTIPQASSKLWITIDDSENGNDITGTSYYGINSVQFEEIDQNTDIMNNANQNANNIINNQNNNTQSIIDNSNSNTQAIIDSNNENFNSCGNLNLPTIEQGSLAGLTGLPQDSTSRTRTSNYINVNSGTTYTLSMSSGLQAFVFYYNSSNTFIERVPANWTTNYTFTPTDNVAKIKIIFSKITGGDITPNETTGISVHYCYNRLDNQTNAINDLDDTIKDDDIGSSAQDGADFILDFDTETFGLTSIVTAPLNLIQSLTSSTCNDLELPLPYLDNKKIILPCMSTIYSQHFGAFFTIYQTITYGIIAYWVIVRIFNQVKDFKNPEHDEIEVVDL